eukprot:m.31640 g.31640  ORF g.31640 m.31640 type:complete len:60 (+) comp6955_c0_seq2:1729-1908(+)
MSARIVFFCLAGEVFGTVSISGSGDAPKLPKASSPENPKSSAIVCREPRHARWAGQIFS